ncbi:bifunctional DedA family/phosphatase PAP2 family protein [Sedimenticola hydrogenitrophicus]|uniref:bifunctional DedA family/phosphatase PAP2 family protein n=1 Tax=Sedimenticola hydrogenitrophicus TaxID=2967975 RepID=UPI0021A4810E|nr:bifunctional DedA family/phosphatase PAP2 family protein [Sedimenticola hydrogenitrophicus]
MTELFQQVLEWVSLHPGWSYSVIFLVAMAESLAVVGLIVPGVVIMFGIGALIAGGVIAFWPAMGWAVAGAVTGDGLSFWVGHHYRERLATFWPFSRHPESLRRGIDFFEKYGGKSVVLGRFFGPTRGVIPLIAGMMDMPALRFGLVNVLSALAWAPLYLLPGIVFGASMELASEVTMRLVILALLLLFFAWAVYNLIRWLFRLLHPHTTRWVQWLLEWGEAHPVMGEIASALADPNHPETRGLSILATLLVIASALFVLLLGLLPGGGLHTGIDLTVLQTLQSLRSPLADELMVYFTRLADVGVIFSLAGGVLLYLFWNRHYRTASHWLAAILFCALAAPLLKLGLQIPRPDIVVQPPDSYSFPSGHVLRAMVLYGFLAVLIARPLSDRWRWLPYSLAGLLILAVASSRLYLGVHWLSDVSGSITLGVAWVALLGLAYHRHAAQESHWRSLVLVSLLVTAAAFSVETGLHHERNLARYQPARTIQQVDQGDWWEGTAMPLPAFRADLRNREEHPLNLQYAGSIDWLRRQLHAAGWLPATRLDWSDGLRLLSPGQPLQALPVLPQVHDGRHETLILEKPLPQDRRLVLRLWATDVRLVGNGTPLWIGNISEQRQVKVLGFLTYAQTAPNFDQALGQLRRDLRLLDSRQLREDGGRVRIREARP